MSPPRLRPEQDLASLYAASPSETTPVLLELARRQAVKRRPADLRGQMERDSFVSPSALDLRLIHQLDGLALDAAAGFEAVLLSPVAPLGCCSVVAPTSQDRTLTTSRGTEVVSDPTNVLALLSATRLTNDPERPVRLCTVHQTLRAQPLPPLPGYTRHFRLFALTEAGPARSEDGFEVEAVTRMVGVFCRLLELATSALGCRFSKIRAAVRASKTRGVLGQRVAVRLREAHPGLEVTGESLDQPYYDGLRVMFWTGPPGGEPLPIGDIGAFDWLSRLRANRRQRFVAGGFGLQHLPLTFR